MVHGKESAPGVSVSYPERRAQCPQRFIRILVVNLTLGASTTLSPISQSPQSWEFRETRDCRNTQRQSILAAASKT